MRSLRMATWTSGEPVSESWVRYDVMSSVFRSLLSATNAYLRARSSGVVLPKPPQCVSPKRVILFQYDVGMQNMTHRPDSDYGTGFGDRDEVAVGMKEP